MSDWIKSFSSQFGDAVCADDATLTAQAVQGVVPACIAAPESETQAAAMIRFAAAHRIPVVPCGGGTSQGRCAPPPKDFLAISTKRLNKLIHHEPGDMVATVHAGMIITDLQDALMLRGQWLPIDAERGATVGGIIAANTCGQLTHGHGTLRDMVLGITVINGDGVVRKCGGKVVKNVTGYALDKLYIGSFGTLGVITEVTFKLRPISEARRSWVGTMSSLKVCIAALRAIAAKSLPLDMLQVSQHSQYAPEDIDLTAHASGTTPELERIESELRSAIFPTELFANINLEELYPSVGPRICMADDLATRVFTRGKERESQGATLRFGYTESTLVAAIEVLSCHLPAAYYFSVNRGIIDLDPLTDSDAARISAEFEKLGVNFAWENVVGVKIPSRWGKPRPEWAIMKQLKAALDPAGIMNPGRFVV